MTRGTLKHLYTVIMLFLIIAGCAKVNTPSGGPKDRIPPRVVKSVPENGMKNFTGKKITITFDEYVVLDKIAEKRNEKDQRGDSEQNLESEFLIEFDAV